MESKATRTMAEKMWLPLAVMACAVALAVSLSIPAGSAWAGGGNALEDIYSGGVRTTVVPKASNPYLNDVYYYSQKNASVKPTYVKTSNPSVLTAEVKTIKGYSDDYYSSPDTYPLVVHLKKAGTATLAFYHAGAVHKVKFVVTNYENPIKSLKVGSKNYATSFNAKNLAARGSIIQYAATAQKNATGKVVVKPKSGWKLYSIASGLTKLKNGSSKTSAWNLDVTLKSTKTGVYEKFHLQQPIPTYATRSTGSSGSSLKAATSAL